jgi:hypothetical protein
MEWTSMILETAMEQAFTESEDNGFGFGDWALSKSALRALLNQLHNHRRLTDPLTIVECGGGQSTVFFRSLIRNRVLHPSAIHTFEHDLSWAQALIAKVGDTPNMFVHYYPLKVISDYEWEQLFYDPLHAMDKWGKMGFLVPQSENANLQIHNAFYNLVPEVVASLGPIDIMIMDGPHGNGRTISCPLLFKQLRPYSSFILIDDFDHYPFLDDLASVFQFRELCREVDRKHWVLVQLAGFRSGSRRWGQ